MHKATLSEQVVVRILQEEPRSFEAILQLCHSIFPNELLKLLVFMEDKGIISYKDNKYFNSDCLLFEKWQTIVKGWQKNLIFAHETLQHINKSIHLPHALDYEWWFMPISRRLLARKLILENILPLPKSIIFLGAPLFGAFMSLMLPGTEIYILDKSSASLEAISLHLHTPQLHLLEYNGENPLSDDLLGKAQMVFFDPPWYIEYYNAFFRRCAWLTHSQIATVGTVLFPILTRPPSQKERNQVLTSAAECGFQLLSLYPRLVQYETPHFEQEALKTQHITVQDWRYADLAIFVSNGQTLLENTHHSLERYEWKEVLLKKTKVKIKVKKDEPDNRYVVPAILATYGTNAIIQSVSRRDPLRDTIDLWTSTHIGLQVRGWRAILRVVEGIAQNLEVGRIAVLIKQDNLEDTGATVEKIELDIKPVWEQLASVLR